MASDDGGTPWQSLHWASPFVNLLPRLLRAVKNGWAIIAAVLVGTGSNLQILDLVVIFAPLAVAFSGAVLHWATLRYRVENGRLELETGLVNRQMRVVPADRVQNIHRIQRILHRATGLVEIEIETASGTEVEGLLSALDARSADALVKALSPAGKRVVRPAQTAPPPVFANTAGDLFRYGATSTAWGAAAVVFGVLLELAQWQDPEWLTVLARQLGKAGGAAAVVAILTGTWLVGVVATMARHWNFHLTDGGEAGGSVAEEGLFTHRKAVIRPGKVQVVMALEPLFRRWAGFGSVLVETASARSRGAGTERSEAFLPVVEAEDIPEVLARFVPHPPLDDLRAPHPSALTAERISELSQLVAVVGLGVALFGAWGLLVALLAPIMWVGSLLDFRQAGYVVTPDVVVARSGWWRRKTWVIPRAKIQSVAAESNPVLRWLGLARLVVRVAGERVALPLVGTETAHALRTELSRVG